MAFSYEIQKVIEKAQNLRFSEDFVLLMAPAGGLEPLAYCLGGKSRLPGYSLCNVFVTFIPGFCIFSVTIIETSSRLKLVTTACT